MYMGIFIRTLRHIRAREELLTHDMYVSFNVIHDSTRTNCHSGVKW